MQDKSKTRQQRNFLSESPVFYMDSDKKFTHLRSESMIIFEISTASSLRKHCGLRKKQYFCTR